MSDLDFTIVCTVTFFSKKRRTPPNLNNGKYCPHLVIKGSERLLGVNFIDGEDVIFNRPIRANALPLNETADYSALQAGTEFLIMESGNIVGKMYFVNEKFKAPKKSNDKEWKIIEYLLLSGYDFRNPYCGQEQCIYFEFPKNLQEAEAFIREMRKLK